MSDAMPPTKEFDPSFFDGWLMIDILSWDWNLRIALEPTATGPEAPRKGLHYGRDFTLHGRIRAPRELRDKSIKLTLAPFGPKVRFGRGGLQHVGGLTAQPPNSEFDFEGVLMLPEDAVATTATSLASICKRVDVRVLRDTQGARALAYSFQAPAHPSAQADAGGD